MIRSCAVETEGRKVTFTVDCDTLEERDIAWEAWREGHVACGWAFDAGMLEAERNRALSFYEEMTSYKMSTGVAVAAERERCAALARRAEGLIYSSAIDTESLRALVRMRLNIESGAPAPKEG